MNAFINHIDNKWKPEASQAPPNFYGCVWDVIMAVVTQNNLHLSVIIKAFKM